MKHIKLKNSVLKGDKDEATGKNNEELSLIRSVINSASTPYPLVLSRDVLSQAPVTTKFVDLINLGRKNTIPAIVKPSKALKTSLKKQLELKKMKELSLQKQSKKEGKKIEELELEEKEKIQKWRSNVKVPRMTSVGAVGLAKSSELQIKNNVVGPIMKKVLFENDRFRNV
ncbi:hypothetical protein HK099_003348 [Clydaea vesicula]|uniref:Uncharacterized protein n=1 Tax=Clydaea vesicula TaxID=447962 RepID=A0AAD5U8F1_9FUNG|nr:hypothetical protein HK099_003348 [Clydaea vesicula]